MKYFFCIYIFLSFSRIYSQDNRWVIANKSGNITQTGWGVLEINFPQNTLSYVYSPDGIANLKTYSCNSDYE